MRITPHILLKTGDVIEIPGGNETWIVYDLVDGHLLCTDTFNVFYIPWGFYFKKNNGNFVPIIEGKHQFVSFPK